MKKARNAVIKNEPFQFLRMQHWKHHSQRIIQHFQLTYKQEITYCAAKKLPAL